METAAFGVGASVEKFESDLDRYVFASANYSGAVDRYKVSLAAWNAVNVDCPDPPPPPPPPPMIFEVLTIHVTIPPHISVDPNDLTTIGFGPQGFIQPKTSILYTIDFANKPTAKAPAQTVTITDKLDSSLDWSTVQLDTIRSMAQRCRSRPA